MIICGWRQSEKENGLSFTLEQLKAFVAVADTGSYSSASRKINRDRTTIREHIDNLQINLNSTLVNKIGHEITLTDFGKIYLRGASSLVFAALQFEDSIKSFNNDQMHKPEYKISICECVPKDFIIHVNNEMSREFPSCNIKWVTNNNYEAREGVKQGIYDLAISRMINHRVKVLPPKGLDGCYLGAITIKIYAGRNSSLAHREILSFQDFINETMYLLTSKSDEGESEKYSYSTRQIQLISYEQIISSMIVGEGWAFLPEMLCLPLVNKGY